MSPSQERLINQQLRVSKAQPFAKLLTDKNYKGSENQSLEMSAKTNMFFKDIDIGKSLELLGQPFTIQPPSVVLLLKDLITMEEVSSTADRR